MAAHGGFDHIDVAFMVHGSTLTQLETPSLALIEMDVEFHGKTAHAGIAPYAGRSAVDAVTMLQTGLGLMRNHLKDSSPGEQYCAGWGDGSQLRARFCQG